VRAAIAGLFAAAGRGERTRWCMSCCPWSTPCWLTGTWKLARRLGRIVLRPRGA